ncbi:MAG TPA: hypothetical protein VGZ33_00980 [Acidimicrobiales bacterium]|nr:hypothetical protein [Acidimicrobiales bacterium]
MRAGVVLVASFAVAAVVTPARAVGADPHATSSRAPSISSMSLSVVNQDEVTFATILGSRFAAGLKVSLGPGVECSVLSVTPTKIALRLGIARTATVGERELTVTNPDRSTAALRTAMRIDYEAILERWAIGQGAVGFATSLVRPTFATPPTVSVSGSGVTVDSATIGPAGTLDLRFTVGRHAESTWRTMTLTEGVSTWQVENGVRIRQAPTVTSVTPLGQSTTDQGVKIQGSNFEVCSGAEPELSISGTGVTVDSVSAALGTLMYAKLTVSPTAPLGLRDVTVTNCDSAGTATSVGAFAVLGPPKVTSVASLALGVSRAEAIVGTNFTPTTTFSVADPGVTIGGVDYVSPVRMRATITVSPTAAVGPHDVTATDEGGASTVASGAFTVDPLPTEGSIAPSGIGAGTTVVLTVNGTGFRRNAEVVLGEPPLPDPSLSLLHTIWVSPTELQVTVTAPLTTALRTDTVTVENLDGGTVATLRFQTDPGPVLALAPSSTKAGSVVATFTAPQGAPAGETYDLRICSSATLSTGCQARAGIQSGGSVAGLTAGTTYWAQLTAAAGAGFYAAVSDVVGPSLATSQLPAPRLSVRPSATHRGAVVVTFLEPHHDLVTAGYEAIACANRHMTARCVRRPGVTSGSLLAGLTQGATYHVVVVALGSTGYLAASSKVSGAVRATVQLRAPTISRATLTRGVLAVTYRAAKGASRSQRYTLAACTNAAMTKGCVVRRDVRSGERVAGVGPGARYVRIIAAASSGFLAARSAVVRT